MMSPRSDRSPGLDLLRALAFLLMCSIHVARAVPALSSAGGWIRGIGEAAPALFFFAFGITTMLFFVGKEPTVRTAQLRALLFLALAHGCYVATITVFDFFFFLFAWQWILTALQGMTHTAPALLLKTVLFIILGALLVLPYPFVHAFSSMAAGPFPLLPWGTFVIAGALFAAAPLARSTLVLGSVAAIAGIGLALTGRAAGWQAWYPTKWPLTAPFLLICVGLCILLYQLVEHWRRLWEQVPLLPQLLSWISQNLLLATTLHFLTTDLIKLSFRFWARSNRERAAIYLRQHDAREMLLLSVVSVALVLVVLAATLWIWPRVADARSLAWLRRHDLATSLSLLALTDLLTRFREHTFEFTGGGFVDPEAWRRVVVVLQGASTWWAAAVMLYFALEMQKRRGSAVSV